MPHASHSLCLGQSPWESLCWWFPWGPLSLALSCSSSQIHSPTSVFPPNHFLSCLCYLWIMVNQTSHLPSLFIESSSAFLFIWSRNLLKDTCCFSPLSPSLEASHCCCLCLNHCRCGLPCLTHSGHYNWAITLQALFPNLCSTWLILIFFLWLV